MKIIELAVVIPTLNEEYYIGKLLDSLAMQTVAAKEIVIVDAFSKDKTIEQVKQYKKILPQLKFYQIPKYTIARQRNLGVSKTKAPYIVFIDADMAFHEKKSLENLFKEINKNKADFAIPKILPESLSKLDAFLYLLHNGIPKTFRRFKAFATTQCLFVSRAIFEKAGGFDEEIKIAEDFDFVSRMQKAGGKFVILKNGVIYSSVRRLEEAGRIRFVGLLTLSFLFILLLGYKKNPIHKKYSFGKFSKNSYSNLH